MAMKNGIFYETFNNDAYIMAYLFDYKIKKMSNCVMVGFPERVIDNVKERLLKEKVSFVIIDEDKQFVSDKSSFTDSNYEVLLDISCKSNDIEMEIEKIKHALEVLKGTKSIEKIIDKIKEII
jgi:hypothetical protein